MLQNTINNIYKPYNETNSFFIRLLCLLNILLPLLGCINLEDNTNSYSVLYLNIFAIHMFHAIVCYIKENQIINNFYGKMYDNEEDFNLELSNYSSQQSINKYYFATKNIFEIITTLYFFDIIYNFNLFLIKGLPQLLGMYYIIRGFWKIIQFVITYYEFERNYRYIINNISDLNNIQNLRVTANLLKEKIDNLIEVNSPNNDCCICFINDNHLNNPWVKLRCNHIMHKKCIIMWFFRIPENVTCPICRSPI